MKLTWNVPSSPVFARAPDSRILPRSESITLPDQLCVELKSLKLYLWSYRDEGAFHEAVINKILDDLVHACQPRKMTVVGDFNIRGGIHTTITASYAQS